MLDAALCCRAAKLPTEGAQFVRQLAAGMMKQKFKMGAAGGDRGCE
jgi:hypothetical protein